MSRDFPTLTSLLDHGADALIDVRSPAEFAEDHIPSAISLPALSNAQRAEVGTIYVQDSPFNARKIGAAMVARNVAAHLDVPLAGHDGSWQPLVYCWRGGQRSGSVASILTQIGWRAETVTGGYQTWRRLVVAALYDADWPTRVILLDGNTGTAKTQVLALLAERGVQTIDLEGLAKHRGSVFGATGVQPDQKGFETALATAMVRLDPARPLVVEAESSKVGARLIPPSLWAAMRGGRRLRIEAPVAARAAYLTQAYADIIADRVALDRAITSLKRLVGGAAVTRWQGLVAVGAFETLAGELIAQHYDPRYARGTAQHDAEATVFETDALDGAALERLADRIAVAVAEG
jgi:tRNA 2-selenouridine synthase